MSSFKSLNFNNGTSVNVGSVTSYWGLSGYNPVTTVTPTGFPLGSYQHRIETLYTSDVQSGVSHLSGGPFSTITEASNYLADYEDALTNHVYWLYGSLSEGGCFIYSEPGSGTAQIVQFYGLYYIHEGATRYYQYYSNSLNVPFKVHVNNDPDRPIVDNTLFFLNANDTSADAPTNHVFDSEHELRVVDCRSLNCYVGLDEKTYDVPVERWDQSQWLDTVTSTGEWMGQYLNHYTDDDLTSITPHPWERWMQNRVVPNLQFFTGVDVQNGELVAGYVAIQNSNAVSYDDDDPNGDSGGPGGGDGDKDGISTDIDTGEVPSSNFLQTGVSRIYLPTQAQMTAFCQYVFSDITQSAVDQLKKMWSNPLDYVENLGVCRLAGITSSGTQNISFGGVSSGVPCNYTNNAFLQFDYTASIGEFWGNALDYSNYTKLKIYIPYCGLYDLNVDEFMVSNNRGGCTITLRYRVDLMSGMCVAMIKPTRVQYGDNYDNLNSYIYQFNGNIYLPLSLTATDWRNTYQSVLGIAGGMIAPSPVTAVGMAESIMSQKVNVQHTGSIGTNFGYMGIQDPYLIIERPAISEPRLNTSYNYETEFGYPSNKLLCLKNANNSFVKVRKNTFWCNNLHATDAERKEIQDLFENEGVWLNYVKE